MFAEDKNNFFGEYYGPQSRCFKHRDQWFLYKCNSVNTPQHSGSGCYKVNLQKLIHGFSPHCGITREGGYGFVWQVSCDAATGLSVMAVNRSYLYYYRDCVFVTSEVWLGPGCSCTIREIIFVAQVSCDTAAGLSVMVGNRPYMYYHKGYLFLWQVRCCSCVITLVMWLWNRWVVMLQQGCRWLWETGHTRVTTTVTCTKWPFSWAVVTCTKEPLSVLPALKSVR